jgi:L-lactate dehydrogenase complex protein LldF
VYSRTGGQAYGSIYPGPIGAILTPQLRGLDQAPTLPWASSLCGACYEACPVRIDIPTVLVHLRGRVVREVEGKGRGEQAVMRAVARVFGSRRRYETAQKLARLGRGPLGRLRGGAPGLGAWAQARDLPEIPAQSFREWWASRERGDGAGGDGGDGAGDSPQAATGTDLGRAT